MIETVQLGKKIYTVKELTIQQIHDLTTITEDDASSAITVLLNTATDMTVEEIMPLLPSELDLIITAMVKVNTPFFQQAARINAEAAGAALERLIRSISLLALIPLSNQAME